jgi:hypothetical protein
MMSRAATLPRPEDDEFQVGTARVVATEVNVGPNQRGPELVRGAEAPRPDELMALSPGTRLGPY